MLIILHIRSFLMSHNSGDASLGDNETINHIVKLLEIYCDFYENLSPIFDYVIHLIH